jgi:DNA polymerase I
MEATLSIKVSKAKGQKVNLTVTPTKGRRDLGPTETFFGHELKELCALDGGTLIYNGLESFGITKVSVGLGLEILRRAPEVYDGSFSGLEPAYGATYQSDDFKQAKALWESAALTHGTAVQEQGRKLREELITSQAGLEVLAKRLDGIKDIALDLETFSTAEDFGKRDIGDTRKSDVRLISLFDGESSWLIDTVACGHSIEPLRPVLERANLVVHNAQFDIPFLYDKYNIVPRGNIFDTLIAARVLSNEAPLYVFRSKYRDIVEQFAEHLATVKELPEEEDDEVDEQIQSRGKERVVFIGDVERTSNSLDAVCKRFLDIEMADESGSDWQAERLSDFQLVYAAEDTKHLLYLKAAILAEADGSDKLIIDLDMLALEVCLGLYREGSLIDVEALEQIYRQRQEALTNARTQVVQDLGGVDLDSGQATIRALGEAGIYVESLEKHDLAKKKDNPTVGHLLTFRRVRAELIDLEKLRRALHVDNRIHARYNPAGAGTGRMSSKSPNLQNIRRAPSKADQAQGYVNFREFFVAPKGWYMIVADYNQAELRGGAVIANERNMIGIYKEGADMHRNTAAELAPKFLDMTPEEQAEARSKAKAANFGLLYGMGAKGFRDFAAKNYGVQLGADEAAEIRTRFFELYPGLAEWHADKKADSWEYPEYGETLLGRKRWLHPLAEDMFETWCGFQAMTNHIVQGSCADMLKLALITIHRAFDPTEARLVGTVHDEIICIARRDTVEEATKIVKDAMEQAGAAIFGEEVTFVSEVKSGASWACK